MMDHLGVLTSVFARWLDDPESAVVHVEEVEGRWAVRMTQEVRDATTVWWTVGERSVRAEAYVLPGPDVNRERAYRLILRRNASAWRCHFGLDAEGAVVLYGRIPATSVDPLTLDLLLGEIYEMVEITFRPLLGLLRETGP